MDHQHSSIYRISDADAERLNTALRQIKDAIFSLCATEHKCLERHCEFCRELEDKTYQIECDLRRLMKNPISKAEADDLERFIERVSL